MNKLILSVSLSLIALGQSFAQGVGAAPLPNPNDENRTFNYREWQETFNKSFGSILGSGGNPSEIGNYASFDPIAGSFKFAGSIPIGNAKKRNIQFFKITAEGAILSDNVSQLFNNGKINTNSTLTGEYHFGMKVKRNSLYIVKDAEAIYNVKKFTLEKATRRKFDQISLSDIEDKKEQTYLERKSNQILLAQMEVDVKFTESVIRRLLNSDPYSFANPVKNKKSPQENFTDSLARATKALSELTNKFNELTSVQEKKHVAYDSLTLAQANFLHFRSALENQIIDDWEKKSIALKDSSILGRFRIRWWSASASIGRKKYYSYDPTQPFADQLSTRYFNRNSIGVSFNNYIKNSLLRRSWLLNMGIQRTLDNNADTLTTTEFAQETVIKNQNGDITRKFSEKYNTYTDPVVSFRAVLAYANFYYLQGRNFGFHVFPSYTKPDGHTGFMNFGLGYIASFKNQKKDNPIINAELYYISKDIFNSLNSDKTIFRRNEIGIKFTLPFNFF